MGDLSFSSPSMGGMKPLDRSKYKPIYIVIANDPTTTGKLQYYRADELVPEAIAMVDIRGWKLTKAQANKLMENPYTQECAGTKINTRIPVHQIIRIDNITYKKQENQGE